MAKRRDPLDPVFRALGDPTRRRILDLLTTAPGSRVREVCDPFPMSRIGVMKHLRILEQADLGRSEKVGRERRLQVNLVPLRMICERWSTRYGAFWAGALTDLKRRIETKVEERERDS